MKYLTLEQFLECPAGTIYVEDDGPKNGYSPHPSNPNMQDLEIKYDSLPPRDWVRASLVDFGPLGPDQLDDLAFKCVEDGASLPLQDVFDERTTKKP